MKILWTTSAWDDYVFWQKADAKVLEGINNLIKDIARTPFKGLGKPEPLKANLKGWRSRRITQHHRLVYRVAGKDDARHIEIAQCRYHY